MQSIRLDRIFYIYGQLNMAIISKLGEIFGFSRFEMVFMENE